MPQARGESLLAMHGDAQGGTLLVGAVAGGRVQQQRIAALVDQVGQEALAVVAVGGPAHQPLLGFPVAAVEQAPGELLLQVAQLGDREAFHLEDPAQGDAFPREAAGPQPPQEGHRGLAGEVAAEAGIDEEVGAEPAMAGRFDHAEALASRGA